MTLKMAKSVAWLLLYGRDRKVMYADNAIWPVQKTGKDKKDIFVTAPRRK